MIGGEKGEKSEAFRKHFKMIKNEFQYEVTKNELEAFRRAFIKLDEIPTKGVCPLMIKAYRESMISQIEIFKREIKEYERKIGIFKLT